MQTRSLLASAFVATSIALGCYGSSGDTTGSTSAAVTFHKDVEPILQKRCLSCHVDGGIAPFSLLTYASAKVYAGSMVAQTSSKAMPPWGAQATSDCTPKNSWHDDPTLTAAELATLAKWNELGAPEGNPADAPPAYVPPTPGLPDKDVEMQPQGPFTVTETTKDTFRCFVLDPKLTVDTYMNGFDAIPGNAQVVHHLLLFSDPKGEGATKPLGPDGGYDCFGGADIAESSLLGAWVPGALPQQYPSDVGTKLTAGTKFVMQIHYHPHTSAAVNSKPDSTRVQLRYTKAPPTWELVNMLIGNFTAKSPFFVHDANDPSSLADFVIPPNAKDVTVTYKLPVGASPKLSGKDVRVYGVAGHMHLVGTTERVWLHHSTGATPADKDECLLSIPKWDFNWQRSYHYEVPIQSLPQVTKTDVLEIKCGFDNTLGNPFLAEELASNGKTQPQTVALGESTTEEMCLGAFQFVTPRAP